MRAQTSLKQAVKIQQPVIFWEGTRKVPEAVVPRLYAMAALLLAESLPGIFRSGNAQGTDSLFFHGLTEVSPIRLEYILPYPGSGKKRIRPQARVLFLADLEPEELAEVAKTTLDTSPDLQNIWCGPFLSVAVIVSPTRRCACCGMTSKGKTNQKDFDEALFGVVSRYTRAWQLLLEQDEDRPLPALDTQPGTAPTG